VLSSPPRFFLCILNRVSGSPGIYGLLALYGASTSTTTLACLAMIIDLPTTTAATFAQKVISVTSEQRVLLLCSYVPFFIIPLCIGVDMAFRLHKLASAGIRALESSKEK
jgi:EXPERA (EXPanded EBP superfamily)